MVKAMVIRDPYDGQPYYCTVCGMGVGEDMACEDSVCELESEAVAQLRARRKRPVGSDLKRHTPKEA